MSFFAIASTGLAGNTESTKWRKVKSPVASSPSSPLGTSASPTPGCNRLTITSPSAIETKLNVTNHASDRPPIRPSAVLSPIEAMPVTIVASTSGATIIRISRRNTSGSSLSRSATCACNGSPAG